MTLLNKLLKALVVAIFLAVGVLLLTLEARAYELYDIRISPQDYVYDSSAEVPEPIIQSDRSFANEVTRLVNIKRIREGVLPVEIHLVLTEAAQRRVLFKWITTGVGMAKNDWGRIDVTQIFCVKDSEFHSAVGASTTPVIVADINSAINSMWEPFANDVVARINIERAYEGLPPVEVHPLLTEAAQIRARESSHVSTRQFIGHDRPNNTRWYTVLYEINLPRVYLGYASENVARGFPNSEETVRAWMESPPHRDNLLSPNWITTGVGVWRNQWGTLDVVQIFCVSDLNFLLNATELYLSTNDTFQMRVVSTNPEFVFSVRWELIGPDTINEHISINEHGLVTVRGVGDNCLAEEAGAVTATIRNAQGEVIDYLVAFLWLSD